MLLECVHDTCAAEIRENLDRSHSSIWKETTYDVIFSCYSVVLEFFAVLQYIAFVLLTMMFGEGNSVGS